MNTLYIDYTHSIPVKQTKAHGGANYTRTLLINILRYLESNGSAREIVILWPKGYLPCSEIEKKIYESDKIRILVVEKTICDISFNPNSTLFIPLLGVKEFPILESLKKKKIKIIMTIHGLRLLDYKIDLYNLYYVIGFWNRIKALVREISLPLRQLIYKHSIKKYSKYVDVVITVSNYTLAKLAKYCQINEVFLQFQGSHLNVNDNDCEVNKNNEKYILFVSGNRSEKNLARTIDAYKQYLTSCSVNIPLHIVGVNNQKQNALIQSLKLNSLIEKHLIVFFDYVDDCKLISLYRNAFFLLYTSKSEGFGLPALEATKLGCPVVAAYGTSIPEILSTNCIYVNPYSIDSIKNGMINMSNEDVRNFYKNKTTLIYDYLSSHIKDSNYIIVKKILES